MDMVGCVAADNYRGLPDTPKIRAYSLVGLQSNRRADLINFSMPSGRNDRHCSTENTYRNMTAFAAGLTSKNWRERER